MILSYTLQFTELLNYKSLKLLKLNNNCYEITKLLNSKNDIWIKKVAKLGIYHTIQHF